MWREGTHFLPGTTKNMYNTSKFRMTKSRLISRKFKILFLFRHISTAFSSQYFFFWLIIICTKIYLIILLVSCEKIWLHFLSLFPQTSRRFRGITATSHYPSANSSQRPQEPIGAKSLGSILPSGRNPCTPSWKSCVSIL